MLRHIGHKRSFTHNLRLAILLCLNAGFINAAGFIAFAVLTTNVTGHAALLAVNLAEEHWRSARMVVLWLFLFLAGAFCSGCYIGRNGRNQAAAYSAPIIVIMLIVGFVALYGPHYQQTLPETEYFAGSLLFAMGMQNALVSMISGSVVRTTHLTGMFTDLGIDLSALAISGFKPEATLKRRILLRISIIISFLAGAVAGALCFNNMSFSAFYIPTGLLFIALFYDYLRVKLRRLLSSQHDKKP